MNYTSEPNMGSPDLILGIDSKFLSTQSLATLALAGIIATSLSYLAFLSYTPGVDKKSPAFTSDTTPLIGSWGFTYRRRGFWDTSVANSKTGNFSFWVGKHHVVGLSGQAARRLFYDTHSLDFVRGANIASIGAEITPPFHEMHTPNFSNGRSYFTRRLLDLMKTDQLAKRLHWVTSDARVMFEAMAKNPSAVINPTSVCHRLIWQQGLRILFTNDIADDPKLMDSYMSYMLILLTNCGIQSVFLPGLPVYKQLKRHYARYRIVRMFSPIIDKRMKPEATRKDDPLQFLIDNGDSKDYMMCFAIGQLFIAGANPGVLSGTLLNVVAHFDNWQEKIYNEIKAATAAYSKSRNVSLVEQLDSLPVDAWDSSFPSIEILLREAIRMWVSFPAIRKNLASHPVAIPGTNEVIPAHSYAAYDSTDAHYNETLYPNPYNFEPERWLEGRDEHKKQAYSFLGWGQGRHPCLGTRWAKIQINITIAYAVAMYKWSGCHADGSLNLTFDRKMPLTPDAAQPPMDLYCKHSPREN